MGDAASTHSADGKRRGRQSSAGSSVLTPPTGMPAIPDLETSVPTQRRSSPPAPVHSPTQPPAQPPAPVQPPAPPAQHTVVDPCTCGHAMAAHEHYRPGTDCSACGRAACGEFRPANGRWRRFLRGVGLAD